MILLLYLYFYAPTPRQRRPRSQNSNSLDIRNSPKRFPTVIITVMLYYYTINTTPTATLVPPPVPPAVVAPPTVAALSRTSGTSKKASSSGWFLFTMRARRAHAHLGDSSLKLVVTSATRLQTTVMNYSQCPNLLLNSSSRLDPEKGLRTENVRCLISLSWSRA